jgi:hypothetical protein
MPPEPALAQDEVVTLLAEMTGEAMAKQAQTVRAMVGDLLAPLLDRLNAAETRAAALAETATQADTLRAAIEVRLVEAETRLAEAAEAVALDGAARAAIEVRLGAAERRVAGVAEAADRLIAEVRADTARDIEAAVTTLTAAGDAQWQAASDAIEAIRQAAEAAASMIPDRLAALDDEIERRQAATFDAHDALRGSVDALAARLDMLADQPPVPGPPGADGLDRPILDMVATWTADTETLPRGILLTDCGSLFVSTREAHGPPSVEPSSWTALAAGAWIAGADHDGERAVSLHVRSGHERIEIPFTLPVPIHRGTWASDAAYQANDLVTWDGALWRATDDLAGVEPGTAPGAGWAMALPRGKTGRPGKDGGRGLAGPQGRGIAAVMDAVVDGHLLIELSDGEVVKVDLSPIVPAVVAAIHAEAQP